MKVETLPKNILSFCRGYWVGPSTATIPPLAILTSLFFFAASTSAQITTPERTPALALKAEVGSAGMEANTLRTALERELSLPFASRRRRPKARTSRSRRPLKLQST